jgi:hypothetical protein
MISRSDTHETAISGGPLLYHALIVQLSPLGPNEPTVRSAWWSSGGLASDHEPRRADARMIPELSVFSRHTRDDWTGGDNRQAA